MAKVGLLVVDVRLWDPEEWSVVRPGKGHSDRGSGWRFLVQDRKDRC